VRPEASWLGSICRTHHDTAASDCQTPGGKTPPDQPEQGIDGYRRKDFEKRKVLRQEWKTP